MKAYSKLNSNITFLIDQGFYAGYSQGEDKDFFFFKQALSVDLMKDRAEVEPFQQSLCVTFCSGVQLLSVFFAGGVRVVPGHGDETVCVQVAHSAHVESGHDEVHRQLAHVTDSHRRLEEE